MKGDAEYAGLVKSETDVELVLNSPEDGLMTLKKTEIQARQRGLSAMPEELVTYLGKRELRDIIEFLALQVSGGEASHDDVFKSVDNRSSSCLVCVRPAQVVSLE